MKKEEEAVQWKLHNGNLRTLKLIDFNFANNSKILLFINYFRKLIFIKKIFKIYFFQFKVNL